MANHIPQMLDDKHIMMLVQKGQTSLIAQLFEHNHVDLYHYFLRMGNMPSHSEDLVQETFMKVIIYKHSYQSTASFRAWLYGIARNTSVDFFHRHQRAPVPEDPAELDTSTEGTLYDNFELNERHRRFAKALERLPHELREILVLHRYQALQYSEIAQLLDCNLNTLKAKMRKAVSELHKNYTEISNGAADES